MAEEAKDEATTIPAAINRVRIAVFAIYFTLPAVALSRAARSRDARTASTTTLLGAAARRRAASPATRSSASSSRSTSARCSRPASSTSACSPRRSCSSPPTPAIIGVSRLVYSMGIHRQLPDAPAPAAPAVPHAVDRDPRLRRRRDRHAAAGPGRRSSATCTRSARCCRSRSRTLAIVRLRVDAARTQPRPYRGPGQPARRAATTCRCSPSSAASARRSRSSSSSRCNPDVGDRRRRLARARHRVYVAYRRRQGLDLTSTHKVAIPQPVVDHEAEYDSVLVHVGDDRYDEQTIATAIKLAARKRRGIHVLVTITVPNSLPIDAPMPEQEAAARVDHRAGAGSRAAGACPGTGRRCAPARRGGGSSRRRRTCARRRS